MTTLSDNRLMTLLDAVRRAPSVLNSQPWRFRVAGGAVDLFADRRRQLFALDPEGRELTISCGAALAVLRVAARHDGLDAHVEPFPSDDPDHLARVTFALAEGPADDRLYRALWTRRTNRRTFRPEPIPADVRAALSAAVAEHGAWLRVLTRAVEKETLSDLVAEAVRVQGRDRAVQEDIQAWLRADGDPRPDGVRDEDQGVWDRRATQRTPIDAVAKHKAALVDEAPALLVLCTEGNDPAAWLQAGLALGDALVVAADRGLSASYANEPIEVGGPLRQRLATLVGEGVPQVLFRLGRPTEEEGSPRRPLGDIVERSSESVSRTSLRDAEAAFARQALIGLSRLPQQSSALVSPWLPPTGGR